MKKFLFLGLIIITSLFLSKTTFATSVSGVNMNGSSGKLEILNNSKNDSAGDFSLSVSLDFDPDSTESTQFKLPQGADNQIVVKLLGSTGKSLVSSKVISVANLKPTSAPIFSAIYPKSDFLKAFPDPSSPENNAFVQIEDFTNKKIYYKSDVFRVFQYNNQNNGGSSILKPSVTTNSASTITQNNAVLNGEITNTGGANANVRGFSYGTTAGYGKNSQKNGSFAVGKFSETISGLTCNTIYHFRALATNSSGTSNGNDVSFTTKACEGSSNNNQQGTTKDFYTFKVKFLPNGVVIDSSQKNALNPGGPDSTLKLCQDHIAKYSDTKKYTILQNCTKTSLLENDNQKYYFTWQEKQDGYKIERENIGKTACETERTSGEYPITTPCSTTSDQANIDTFNKALGSKGETTEPQDPPKEFNSEYKLLAPIGNLTSIGGNSENKIGDYLNVVLMIAIGLCGALAVIMIVIRGVQYMGDESVFGKTEAKHHIMQAVLGLILALGAYALLNTINPKLVGGKLSFNSVEIVISADDTSTGSSTSLCLSNPPPNPDSAKGVTITLNSAEEEYKKEINKLGSIPKGIKLLMVAQTHVEGFSGTTSSSGVKTGTKSYRTNNPGNISNTDKAPANWNCSSPGINCFDTLAEGIAAQSEMYKRIGTNTSPSYVIGGKNKCALGTESYNGSLYQYLWIYSTGARDSNSYVNQIIGYFAQEGKTITARTKMSEIYNMK